MGLRNGSEAWRKALQANDVEKLTSKLEIVRCTIRMPSGRVRLANSELEVEVVPGEGGRIASLRSVHSGLEFLTQAQSLQTPIRPGLEADFARGPCAGADECLPTVGASADREGRPAPDHGDFWQLPWTVDAEDEACVSLYAMGFSRPLRFARQLRLKHSILEMDYQVRNTGPEPLSVLYAWHPLFAVDRGDRVVLPAEVKEVKLTHSRTGWLGAIGRNVAWPLAGGVADLSVAPSLDAGTAEMFYTGRLNVGQCGLYRNTARQGIVLRFNTERLPYLGLWFCFGGWPEDTENVRQVAIALEPTMAPCGTLGEAEANGFTPRLQPGETLAWRLCLEVMAAGQPYREFAQSALSP